MPIRAKSFKATPTEMGRIRLGFKPKGKNFPSKLENFRITSPFREVLEGVAGMYGGEVVEWNDPNANPSRQFEVFTDVNSLDVILPSQMEFDQWFEGWRAGGCWHRCDGYDDRITKAPCEIGCGERDDSIEEQERSMKAREDAGIKPVTRFSVMLAGIPGLGSWRLETHGYYAAKEFKDLEDKVYVLGMTAAKLVLSERVVKRNGKTNKFAVPSLALPHTPEQVALAIESIQAKALDYRQEERAAIEGVRTNLHEPSRFDPSDPMGLDAADRADAAPATDEQVAEVKELGLKLGLDEFVLREKLLQAKDINVDDMNGLQGREVLKWLRAAVRAQAGKPSQTSVTVNHSGDEDEYANQYEPADA